MNGDEDAESDQESVKSAQDVFNVPFRSYKKSAEVTSPCNAAGMPDVTVEQKQTTDSSKSSVEISERGKLKCLISITAVVIHVCFRFRVRIPEISGNLTCIIYFSEFVLIMAMERKHQ